MYMMLPIIVKSSGKRVLNSIPYPFGLYFPEGDFSVWHISLRLLFLKSIGYFLLDIKGLSWSNKQVLVLVRTMQTKNEQEKQE